MTDHPRSPYPISGVPETPPPGGGGIGVFDSADAIAINRARLAHLDSLDLPLSRKSVLDVGCGVGHLSRFFVERGCRVTCVDGRRENIDALRLRYPGTQAHVANVETDSLSALGSFEVVFCYGLLYHLENPVAGLRNMAQVCTELLLLETVVTDHAEPILRLLDEPAETKNQALGGMGGRPSPAFVGMTLTRAGFGYVYAPKHPPDHPDFQFKWKNSLRFERDGHLLRCIFVASRQKLQNPALSLLLERPSSSSSSPFLPLTSPSAAKRVWLDVGAHLGEKTLPAAQADPSLRVYAFEPNLAVAARRMGTLPNFIVLPMAVTEQDGSTEFHLNAFDAASSVLPLNHEGRRKWIGGDDLIEERHYPVPTIRLDTFLNSTGIGEVEFLKVDAQGADLAVIRSAGERLKDIRKISLEVQVTPTSLYLGASDRAAVLRFMEHAGFQLASTERQSHDQEENLTFYRSTTIPMTETDGIRAAESLAFVRPLVPYPGWNFGSDFNNPQAVFQQRRRLWEFFRDRKLEVPFVFDWYEGLRLNLYLGNDLSRQLFVAGCSEPNEFAFLDQILSPGMIFIDGGANDGLFTLFAARRVGQDGKVWAFEPSEREFERLQQNLSLNQLQNVQACRVALADREGEEDLSVAGYEHEGQNTLGAFVHQGIQLARTEHVCLRKLDDLVRDSDLARVDVIKLDVEGSEYRVLVGARHVLARFRPVVLFEALDAALQQQGSSRDRLIELLTSLRYRLFVFDERSGRPAPAEGSRFSANMIAVPIECPVVFTLAPEAGGATASPSANGLSISTNEDSPLSTFIPALAYWNQRVTLSNARERILSLSQAVDQRSDLWPYQWAQLMAAAIDFAPDLILELGRGKGNSTCAFTEASNINEGRSRILSLCLSDSWERETLPRLRKIVPGNWFHPLQAQRADILEFDYRKALSGAKRVLIFWDAHGFDIAECVLGEILPIVAPLEHLVIMHDLSDTRYTSDEQFEYGDHGLWKGNNWSGPRLKIGIIDSAVEQSIAALDFTTRNHLTLDSADHSFHTALTSDQQTEMRRILGDLFDTQAHWFYFSLNERPGPYKFPHFTRPRVSAAGGKSRR